MDKKWLWLLGAGICLMLTAAPADAQVRVGVDVGAPWFGVGVDVGPRVYFDRHDDRYYRVPRIRVRPFRRAYDRNYQRDVARARREYQQEIREARREYQREIREARRDRRR
jgi:hypothetical protein